MDIGFIGFYGGNKMQRGLTLEECIALLKPLEKLGYIDNIITEDNIISYHIINFDNQNPNFVEVVYTDTIFDLFCDCTESVVVGMHGDITVSVYNE